MFRQYYKDLEIEGSDIIVNINAQNKVTMIINGYISKLSVDTKANITENEANEIALGTSTELNKDLKLITNTKQKLLSNDEDIVKLVYIVNLTIDNHVSLGTVIIDASTGEILKKSFQNNAYVNGAGKVFDPDPGSELRTTSLNYYSNVDQAYKTRTLENLDDPDGQGYYHIQGKYARSVQLFYPYFDLASVSNKDAIDFNHHDIRFSEVNIYYFINKIRTYVGNLGFSPLWLDSQLHKSWIKYDAAASQTMGDLNCSYINDLSGEDEYIYFGYADNQILWSLDQSIIVHEYGHALHDALLLNGFVESDRGTYSTLAGMGEGIGDYLAISFRRSLQQGNPYRPNEASSYAYPNARTSIKSTNNANYSTWNQESNYGKGSIWASTLMDIEYNDGTNPSSGTNLGRDITTKLLLTGIGYITKTASPLDYVNAILQADRDLYSGIHLSNLEQVFRNRGFFSSYEVSGTITTNTTWTGVRIVTGDVTVASGVTLTISPHPTYNLGSFIFFDSGKSLVINGSLIVNGTSSEQVSFDRAGNSGNWVGIRFNSGSNGNIDNAYIEHAVWGVFFNNLGNNSVAIYNSYIQNNSSYGIWCENSSLMTIRNNHILNNGSYGIYCNNYSSPYIAQNVIKGHAVAGVYGSYYSNPVASYTGTGHNVIKDNQGCGLYANYNSNLLFGQGSACAYNSIYNNSSYEAKVENNGVIWAQYNYWGSGSTIYPTGSPNIYWNYQLGYDPNAGQAIILSGNKTDEASTMSLSARNTSSNIEMNITAQNDNSKEELNKWKNIFKENGNNSDGRYALTKIEELCYATNDGSFEDFVNSEIFSRKGIKDELTVMGYELINHSLLTKGDFKNAIKNLENIKDELLLNESIEKNTLFELGSIYLNYLNDTDNAAKYFAELKQKYPQDILTLNSDLLFDNYSGAVSSKFAGNKSPLETNVFPAANSEFQLIGNYPNPFNPTTTISYSLPNEGHVQIRIFDILGREVSKLVDENKNAGKYNVVWDGSNAASGIYFSVITFNGQSFSKKMLLIK